MQVLLFSASIVSRHLCVPLVVQHCSVCWSRLRVDVMDDIAAAAAVEPCRPPTPRPSAAPAAARAAALLATPISPAQVSSSLLLVTGAQGLASCFGSRTPLHSRWQASGGEALLLLLLVPFLVLLLLQRLPPLGGAALPGEGTSLRTGLLGPQAAAAAAVPTPGSAGRSSLAASPGARWAASCASTAAGFRV
jgi:hypothetical protein